MSKPSRRANRETLKAEKKARKHAQQELRRKQIQEGLTPSSHTTSSNHKCKYKTTEEEGKARNTAVWDMIKVFRSHLPLFLKRFDVIPDPRNPKKTKHKLAALMIYGVLLFIFQMASSREATREMTRPMFLEQLKIFFPQLENVPHHDTLKRLLSEMDVSEIENIQLDLVRKLIRKKKFAKYLINNCYPVAIDGTQKMSRDELWDEECLERTHNRGKSDEHTQYYVYVMQANLAFAGGMSIPLMSEFLSYTEGDTGNGKQDCETKAFHRLSNRLKKAFPALRIMLLMDGLYAQGPVMEACCKNKWQYMIVAKNGSIPSLMKEFETLAELEPTNRHFRTWGNRKQRFKWINEIEYRYGANEKKKVVLHMVECKESWQEIEKGGTNVVEKSSRHVWISSVPLDRWNLHELCNLGARARWTIENNFLVEKRHGYNYEHCFSYDWKAMKGYHYLMQLGHLFNILARYSTELAKVVKELGVRGMIRFVRETMVGPWLDKTWLSEQMATPYQLRLI